MVIADLASVTQTIKAQPTRFLMNQVVVKTGDGRKVRFRG